MDSQSAETSDGSLCLAALVHFLDRIDQDTKEWYYAINGNHNHPYSLCSIFGLSFNFWYVVALSTKFDNSEDCRYHYSFASMPFHGAVSKDIIIAHFAYAKSSL